MKPMTELEAARDVIEMTLYANTDLRAALTDTPEVVAARILSALAVADLAVSREEPWEYGLQYPGCAFATRMPEEHARRLAADPKNAYTLARRRREGLWKKCE